MANLILPNGQTISTDDPAEIALFKSRGARDQSSVVSPGQDIRQVANTLGAAWNRPGGQGNADAMAQGLNDPTSDPSNPQPFSATAQPGTPSGGSASTAAGPESLTVREGSEFIDNYMNPFTDNVVNAFETDWDRALQMAQNSNNALATSKGAFGGSGHGVASSLTNERALDQYDRAVSGMRSSAFDNAAKYGLADAGAYNNMEGLSANLAMQGASLIPQIAGANANLFNNDLGNLLSIGGAQQQLGQSGLDLAYNDHLKQWQYPMDMLGWASGLASGVPTGATTTGEVPADTGGKLGGAGSLMSGGAALAGK